MDANYLTGPLTRSLILLCTFWITFTIAFALVGHQVSALGAMGNIVQGFFAVAILPLFFVVAQLLEVYRLWQSLSQGCWLTNECFGDFRAILKETGPATASWFDYMRQRDVFYTVSCAFLWSFVALRSWWFVLPHMFSAAKRLANFVVRGDIIVDGRPPGDGTNPSPTVAVDGRGKEEDGSKGGSSCVYHRPSKHNYADREHEPVSSLLCSRCPHVVAAGSEAESFEGPVQMLEIAGNNIFDVRTVSSGVSKEGQDGEDAVDESKA